MSRSALRSLPLGLLVLCGAAPFLIALTYSYGAPPGLTGAPRPDGQTEGTCTACHNSYDLDSGTGSVTVEGPATYAPGETVTLTVTVDNTTPLEGAQQEQGFELAVKDESAEHAGTLGLSDDGLTQFPFGDPNYVTHSSTGSTASTWTVTWTAPAEEAPARVTAYAVGNATNGNNASVGDYVYSTSFTMALRGVDAEPEPVPSVLRVAAPYPNPLPSGGALRVAFTLDQPREVALALYDGLGRAVVALDAQTYAAGPHAAALAPGEVPAGIYFLAVEADGERTLRAVTVVR